MAYFTYIVKKSRLDITERASQVCRCLERAWLMLREIDPRIPEAVIIPLARSRRGRRGHFAPNGWKINAATRAPEVAVSPALFQRPKELLATLLHEAAHGILYQDEPESDASHVAGCGQDLYYHRKEFRDVCRGLGLICEFLNTRYGWVLTRWPKDGVPPRYHQVAALLRLEMPYGAGSGMLKLPAGRKTPTAGHHKLICQCKPPRAIYASRSVAECGQLRCVLYGSDFGFAD